MAMFCKYIYFSKCTPINGKGGGSKHHVVEKWYNVTIVTTDAWNVKIMIGNVESADFPRSEISA